MYWRVLPIKVGKKIESWIAIQREGSTIWYLKNLFGKELPRFRLPVRGATEHRLIQPHSIRHPHQREKVNAASRRQCNDIVSSPRMVQLTKLLNHFACWNHPKQTSDVMVGVVINTAWYATRHTNQIPFPGMTMLAIKI
jgi:hypothetical protein